MKRLTCVIALGCLGLGGCDPVTMGLVTASGGMAVNHQMAATATRTFSEGTRSVRDALLAALDHMSMVVRKREMKGEVEVIQATAGNRNVSLRVEPVTRTSTLLEVAVHQDLLTMDGATAREIVAQTEHALGSPVATATLRDDGHLPAFESSAGNPQPADAPGRTTYFGRDDGNGHKANDTDRTRATRLPRASHTLATTGTS